ncbi:hypothetical protein C2E23DRAFT_881266 [Lenzites betulinus]|nr:hypothetical protein C2E23DRAFT_881266 [Lenzites betulinus]
MDLDMQTTPMRVTRSATKRARSPSGSSPSQHDRPSKRATGASSGHDAGTSAPHPFPAFQTSPASHGLPTHPPTPRLRNAPLDWVSQTQSMRLASPASEQSGFSTPGTVDEHGHEQGQGGCDEVMADEQMPADEDKMSVSPPRPSIFSVRAPSPSRAASPSSLPRLNTDTGPFFQQPQQHHHQHNPQRPRGATLFPQGQAQNQSQNRLQIPAIQVQAATPSPVQLFSQPPLGDPCFAGSAVTIASPPVDFLGHGQQQQGAQGRKQRFTMGPRADCEMCRLRVKGHYMHFD